MPNIPTSSTPPNVPPPGKPAHPESTPKGKKLLDQYSEFLRNRHYSHRTEQTYVSWVRQFILYHKKRHPREMGAAEINDFITYLVNHKRIAASTQNQAISAILFLYRNVLSIDPSASPPFSPARKPGTSLQKWMGFTN
jgi:site-specific recombinase XerD